MNLQHKLVIAEHADAVIQIADRIATMIEEAAGVGRYPPKSRDDDAANTSLPARARAALDNRRKRDMIFERTDMFGEPAWDILLIVAARLDETRPTFMKDVMQGANTAPTTMLRHVGCLEQWGLLTRRADNSDGRRVVVDLTPTALHCLMKALNCGD